MSRRRRSQAQRRRIDKASLPQRVQQAGGQARAISPAQQLSAQEQGGLSALMYGGAPFAAMPRTDPMVPFGPGVPLLPAPLDPPGASGRPGPRQWEYPITWNLPGFGDRHLPWGTLRAASRVDIVRDCISVIKKELTGLDWSIAVSEDAVEDLVQSGQADRRTEAKRMLREKLQPDISRARDFWRRPDKQNGLNFQDWFWGVLEEVLVLDALPIYPYESLGGQTLGLRVIDGATIKPLIDHLGLRPAPPQPAFQQILHGFPRGEFTAAADPDGTIDDSFSTDELIYVRREVRASSPYGFSPVESALSRINLWLKRMDWMTKEWDSGSLPQAMMEVPETSKMSPADLIRWREAINAHLGGDTVERHRIQVSIPGGKLARFTDAADAYKPEYDTFLVKILCSAFGIAPAEIGFIETGGLGGASYHEGQADIQNRKGIAPWVRWFQELFRDINIRYLGLDPAVEFRFQGLKHDDEAERDKVIEQRVASGRMTLNEARDEQGMPPYPFHEADQPYVQTGAGVTFLEGQRQIADAQAEAQVAGAQMATQNLQSGKLPSGKDPNTPRTERADGDEARPDDGSTPSADLDEDDAEESNDEASKPNKPTVEKNTRAADELDAFGRWATKAVKGRTPLRRPFTFGTVDEATGRQLNALAADGLAAEAAVLAKAQAAELRKAGGGAPGGAPPPPGGWQGFAALDILTPRLSPLVSQGARRLIDPAGAAEALHARFPAGSTADRTALVAEIRQLLGEHAHLGALAPALTEIYRTGWDAGTLCAERMVAASRPPGLEKAAADAALEKKFNPRQARDWRGRWGSGGPGASPDADDAAGRHDGPTGEGPPPAAKPTVPRALRRTLNLARVELIGSNIRVDPDHDPHDPGMAGPRTLAAVDALRTAGAAIDDEIRSRAEAHAGYSRDTLRQEVSQAQDRAFDANSRLDEIEDQGGPSSRAERREVARLQQIVEQARATGQQVDQRVRELEQAERDVRWKVLREVRPMGGELNLQGGNRKGRTAAADAAQFMPAAWIERSNAFGPLEVKATNERGRHTPALGGMSTIITNPWNTDDGSFRATTLHEMTHRMEIVYPALRTAEWGFWTARNSDEQDGRRTWTSPVVSMADINPSYGPGEKTRRDDFVQPYMGKIYPNSRDGFPRAFEVAPVGAEALAAGAEYADEDPDLRHFLLGTWAIL